MWGCPKEVRYQDVNCVGMERRLDTGQVSTPDWWFDGWGEDLMKWQGR